MAFTKKIVGSLEFNQEEGEIKHIRTGERLAKFPVKFAIPVVLLGKRVEILIDSTGIKEHTGEFVLTSEMVKHLKEAYLEARAEPPSAADASVDVELYNDTDDSTVTSLTFAGEGGYKVTSNIASTLKTLAGKRLAGRLNVRTASATSGATQRFRSIVLRLVYDFT